MDRKLLKLETAARRGGSSVCRLVVMGMLSAGVAFGGQTWKANPASAFWNLTDANWTPGDTWAGGSAAFGESSVKDVAVSGVVSVTNVSFTADGYTVGGDGVLEFPGTDAVPAEIAVADGVTATLAAAATNAVPTGTVRKTGGGTLVLAGATSLGSVAMEGGTFRLVEGGLLSVINIKHTGSTPVTLEADGGLLQIIGSYGLPTEIFKQIRVGTGGLHLLSASSVTPKYWPILESDVAGEVDGGLHLYGQELMYWFPARATYTGGTYWENSAWGVTPYIAIERDNQLGVVPAEPADNLFVHANVGRLHFAATCNLHRNRDILIGTNCTFGVAVQNTNTLARICGRIHGPKGYEQTTRLFARSSYWNDNDATWTGTLSLSPGEGRTNRIGRLTVDLPVRIESGVTLLVSTTDVPTGTPYQNNVPLDVEGTGSAFTETKGVLTVTGGVLRVVERAYTVLRRYGQVRVTGGLLETTFQLLNGLSSPGRTTVGGTGRILADQVRLSQAIALDEDGLPQASVNVCTGGVLQLNQFYIDEGPKKYFDDSLNLDGGTVKPRRNESHFLGTGAPWWDSILVRVCAGGAVFDTDGFNITVRCPLRSGATVDGGLVKRGAGTLTLASTNTYNGITRVEAGKLAFTDETGYPGGSLEFLAATLMAQPLGTPLVTAKSLSFRDGCGIRITDAERLDLATFGKPRTLVTATTPFTSVPPVTFVASDGTIRGTGNGWGGWTVVRSADGCSLLLSGNPGTTVILR